MGWNRMESSGIGACSWRENGPTTILSDDAHLIVVRTENRVAVESGDVTLEDRDGLWLVEPDVGNIPVHSILDIAIDDATI